MKTLKQILRETACESDDYGSEMTIRELQVALNAAQEMIDMLKNGGSVERWGESKITLASDYLVSVCTFMKAQPPSMEAEEPEEYIEPEQEYVGHEYTHFTPFFPYVYEQVEVKTGE
jgi:hypothetical protein